VEAIETKLEGEGLAETLGMVTESGDWDLNCDCRVWDLETALVVPCFLVFSV